MNLAITDAMLVKKYKPSDCLEKWQFEPITNESENILQNEKETVILPKAFECMNFFIDNYGLFCVLKDTLLKIYKHKCYDSDTFIKKKDGIASVFWHINFLTNQVLKMETDPDNYWLKYMLNRFVTEIKELYIKNDVFHIEVITGAEQNLKLVKANKEGSEEEKSIAIFNETCNSIQKRFIEVKTGDNTQFENYNYNDYILSGFNRKRRVDHESK